MIHLGKNSLKTSTILLLLALKGKFIEGLSSISIWLFSLGWILFQPEIILIYFRIHTTHVMHRLCIWDAPAVPLNFPNNCSENFSEQNDITDAISSLFRCSSSVMSLLFGEIFRTISFHLLRKLWIIFFRQACHIICDRGG